MVVDPLTAQAVMFIATQTITWAAGSFASWQQRDDIRRGMADADAYMQSLYGAREWLDGVAGAGSVYRGIAEKLVNQRKRLLSLSVYNAERAAILGKKYAAFTQALSVFESKVSPALDLVRSEMAKDDILVAKDKLRIDLFNSAVEPVQLAFVSWAENDPRRMVDVFGDDPEFPLQAEEVEFYRAFYDTYRAVLAYVADLERRSLQFAADYTAQAMVAINPYPDKPEQYATPGTSYQPRPLSAEYPEFVELAPQGIVTKVTAYAGDPAGFESLAQKSIAAVMRVNEVVRAKWDTEVLVNFTYKIHSRGDWESLAVVTGNAALLPDIARYREVEHIDFKLAVPESLRRTVTEFYVFERHGVSNANFPAKLAAYAGFAATQSSRWDDIAKEQAGDGSVYSQGVDAYAVDGEMLHAELDEFIDAYVAELNSRAAMLSSDERIEDLFSGKAVYRNPTATRILNADGTTSVGPADAPGILALAGAALLLLQ